MIRAFKYVLLPNRAQERTLAHWLERRGVGLFGGHWMPVTFYGQGRNAA